MPRFLEHSATAWRGQRLEHPSAPMDAIDPRVRLLAAAAFALTVVFSSAFPALILGLLLAVALALSARLSLRRTLRRVIAMDLFMLFLLIMLPFTMPGETLFQIGGMSASKEGLLRAFEIILKANAVILALLSLAGTLEATTLGHALARLGAPHKLVHLLLFTVRYLDVISREYRRMRKAMRARAFVARSNRHTWRSIGYLIGMLLVRSLERSERILAAMKCRGYNGHLYLLDDMRVTRADAWFLAAGLPGLASIIGLNLL